MKTEKTVYDYLVIGSGFGGSVSAMRLSQKGYHVAVLESGKRWKPSDFPKTNWRVNKFLWMPKFFMYGIQRITLLRNVMILSGSGVGGGSLVYANTLYFPKPAFFENPTVGKMGGESQMSSYFKISSKMLGVVTNQALNEVDEFMKDTAAEFGRKDSFGPTDVGIYFGKPEITETDPYFLGEGPMRTGCNLCGGCMVGCRFDSKNTLDKNYLYFAEKFGTEIFPETQVTQIIPLSEDGKDGYEIHTRCPTGIMGFPKKKFYAKNLILSAGVLGTVNLLLRMKENGRMPQISNQLGKVVRTNSEAIIGVTSLHKKVDFSKGIAISSSVYPDDYTHIEPVRYSSGSDVMGLLATVLTDGGGKIPRQLRFLWNIITGPIGFLRTTIPFGFAKKSIILLVMQTLDNSIQLIRKRSILTFFRKKLTSIDQGPKIPTFIPVANEFARKLAKKVHGVPRSAYNEVLLDVPTTAHILGGCCIGETPETGVVDLENRLFGYPNIRVCDGSMIPANLGVNPSLSIAALSERAMSFIPLKQGKNDPDFLKIELQEGFTSTLNPVK